MAVQQKLAQQYKDIILQFTKEEKTKPHKFNKEKKAVGDSLFLLPRLITEGFQMTTTTKKRQISTPGVILAEL